MDSIVSLFESYPFWVRIFFFIWLFLGIGVFVFTPRNERVDVETKPMTQFQQSTNFGNQINSQLSAGVINVYQGVPSPPVLPVKEQIRNLLRVINPIIIRNLDRGDRDIAVMINQTNYPDLLRLSKDPAFGDYLEIKSTGSISMGSGNSIGGHINDVNDVGMLNGFVLIFKPALKE